MKKFLFTTLGILVLSATSLAQTTSEVFDFANTNNLGTARYNGLSGAFGALGGDLTGVAENPAGGAVFTNSYGSVTLSQGGSNFNSTYFNTTTEASDANFNFNQIGGILILKNTSGSKSINKISLGILYNRDNNYNREYAIQGNSSIGNIGDYFAGQADGYDIQDISQRQLVNDNGVPLVDEDGNEILEDFLDAYIDIGELPGLEARGQQAFLATTSNIISPDTNNNRLYNSEIVGSNNSQQISTITSGGSSKVSINLAFEIDEKIYLGGNLNFHNYDLRKNTLISEVNNNTTDNISEVFFETRSRTFGNGFSLNLGGIAKIGDQLRLGLSYQTPTWSVLQNELDQNLTTFLRDQGPENPRNVDPGLVFSYPEYDIRTPGEVSASIAYVFGKDGLLSAQYSRKDFSNIKYDDNAFDFDILNNRIKNTFQAVNSLKIGGEYRYEKWRFRGGLSYVTSPYKNDRIAGDTQGFSLGTGYDWGKWKLDIGYNHFEIDSNEVPFENDLYNNAAAINRKGDAVSVTLGVNF
ncbi:OmpP1/FadL family transporter [Aquimarina agarilytica]|uniref:OmpP1/FadL family transporter n=1 Tax=Aquimarina agarilytica TaxID=1087449 RepID=UPI000287C0F2|nr:hemin receptor [Aquimarina agarilytica]